MLKLELSLEKVNLVLGALAKLPYEVVAELIKEIQEQAKPQLESPKEVPQKKQE